MRNRIVLFLAQAGLLFTLGQSRAADTTAPTVFSTTPAPGATVVRLFEIEVVFDEDVQGVQAQDLLINGLGATNLVTVNPNQYRFDFSTPPTGAVQVAWASGHGITDLAGNPFAGGSWSYTLNPALAIFDVRINEFMADNQTTLRD